MPSFPYTWFNLNDSAIGELVSVIGAGDTTLSLKSGQGIKFPTTDFCVRIENEWIYCANRTTDTLNNLTRGYDSSTATSHGANSLVFQAAHRGLFQRIYDNLNGHQHVKADVTDFTHNHAQGDITSLVSDLAGKASTSHDILTSHSGFPGGTSNFLRADGTFAAPAGGGSDPWSYVRLASDFPTTSATAVDVTGLSLTPSANLRYEIEGLLLLRTNTATVGPRPGIAWPTGMTDGVATIDTSSSATARLLTNGNIGASMLAAVGGLPNTTQSWPAKIHATLIAGASPGGTFRLQLASETAGTTVTMTANSWFRWRIF